MFGLDCRLDRIQGRRPVFVFGNPIIKTLCATVGFSDVTSANVVGYDTVGRVGAGAYMIGGNMFTSVGGGQATWSLDDLQIVDGGEDPTACTIQFLQATSPKTMNEKSFYYVPRWMAGDDCGWYYKLTVPGKCAADTPVPQTEKLCEGEGILVNFPVAAAKLVFDSPIK